MFWLTQTRLIWQVILILNIIELLFNIYYLTKFTQNSNMVDLDGSNLLYYQVAMTCLIVSIVMLVLVVTVNYHLAYPVKQWAPSFANRPITYHQILQNWQKTQGVC